ncbi:MAG: hypothetical protein ABW168_08850 [Sedimenticola sp.]
MGTSSLAAFQERVFDVWLPSFCDAPHRCYSKAGFKRESISNLEELDAYWFLEAVDLGLVYEEKGCFVAPLSKAKEQIFWEGSKKIEPRPITLWIEPVITIGALAKLYKRHGWPKDKLGAQSKTWAFDLVGYGESSEDELLACEVKKSAKEIDSLIELMKVYGNDGSIEEPDSGKERNAYKKVAGIIRSWPSIFFALGPSDYSKIFTIMRKGKIEFILIEQDASILNYDSLNKKIQPTQKTRG